MDWLEVEEVVASCTRAVCTMTLAQLKQIDSSLRLICEDQAGGRHMLPSYVQSSIRRTLIGKQTSHIPVALMRLAISGTSTKCTGDFQFTCFD